MPRGKHNNHIRGDQHWNWRGGNPPPDPEKRRANAKASAKRYPERRRARERVKDAVRRGDLAPIKTCTCVDCGASAQAYDHAYGYDQPLKVDPVCYKCHGRRSRKRGEHTRVGKHAAGRLLDGVEHNAYPE